MAIRYTVTLKEQIAAFDTQDEARAAAKKYMDAGLYYMSLGQTNVADPLPLAPPLPPKPEKKQKGN